MKRRFFSIIMIVVFGIPVANAQMPSDSISKYKREVEQMIDYLEGTLNMLGDEESTQRERQIIINDSYSKMFVDDKVQVEDDLDENRQIVTYKDVQAYMKDITFFFKQISFEFEVVSIEERYDAQNELFFLVSMNRRLKGTTIENVAVENIVERFVEIDYNQETQNLKIVSIYTTPINKTEQLKQWWNGLDLAWKQLLAKQVGASSVISDTQLNQLVLIEHIDLSGNKRITSLKPIGKFSKLKEIRCANTNIDDLMPIRNLLKLEILDISHTKVNSLEPLRYANKLQEINISHTPMSHLAAISYLENLRVVDASHTSINNVMPLKPLEKLEEVYLNHTQVSNLAVFTGFMHLKILNLSNSKVYSLSGLKNLPALEKLYCKSTKISDIAPLANLPKLSSLYIDQTSVSNIDAWLGLCDCERISCDKTGGSQIKASKFMEAHPKCMVIYNSAELQSWWNTLSSEWKKVFLTKLGTQKVTVLELHKIAQIEQIDIANNPRITSLAPLSKLLKLRTLHCANTKISSLEALKYTDELVSLNCSNTPISDLMPLSNLRKIQVLKINKTKVSNLEPLRSAKELSFLFCENTEVKNVQMLHNLRKLSYVYADNSRVNDESIYNLRKHNKSILVIYQSEHLKNWWNNLPKAWQQVFREKVKLDNKPSNVQLQELIEKEELMIESNSAITSLEPITQFMFLRKFSFTDGRIINLDPLKKMARLEELDISKNQISNISALSLLKKLVYLNIENTQVDDLLPIANLKKLKTLKVSGTQIKNLRGIENLKQLKNLDLI